MFRGGPVSVSPFLHLHFIYLKTIFYGLENCIDHFSFVCIQIIIFFSTSVIIIKKIKRTQSTYNNIIKLSVFFFFFVSQFKIVALFALNFGQWIFRIDFFRDFTRLRRSHTPEIITLFHTVCVFHVQTFCFYVFGRITVICPRRKLFRFTILKSSGVKNFDSFSR